MSRLKKYWFVLLVMFCVSCGWHGTGVVVEKNYDPAWVQTTTRCQIYGKTTICLPDTIYWPESWSIQVKDEANKKHWVDVSEQEYLSISVGSSYTNG